MNEEKVKDWLYRLRSEINFMSVNPEHRENFKMSIDEGIKAIETVEEFEKAQIITGGRLNGRTFAYKCGLEDGKCKAREKQSDDCVSREAVINIVNNTIAKYIPTFIGLYEKIPLELARAIKDVPPVTPTRNKPKEDITEDEVRINMLELALNQAKEHAESIEVLTENHRLIFRAEKRGDSNGSN